MLIHSNAITSLQPPYPLAVSESLILQTTNKASGKKRFISSFSAAGQLRAQAYQQNCVDENQLWIHSSSSLQLSQFHEVKVRIQKQMDAACEIRLKDMQPLINRLRMDQETAVFFAANHA